MPTLVIQSESSPFIENAVSTPTIVHQEGPITLPGDSGADKNYVHDQAAASVSWTITHNLGKNPSVTVVTLQDVIVIGEVVYDNLNQVTVNFSAPFSGKAYLN